LRNAFVALLIKYYEKDIKVIIQYKAFNPVAKYFILPALIFCQSQSACSIEMYSVFTSGVSMNCIFEVQKMDLNIEVFPTFSSEEITVKYMLKTSTDARLNIVDRQGQVIYTESVDGLPCFNVFNKKIGDIAPGTYYISILAIKPESRFRTISFINS
jgi:hypothetical protein